MTGAPLDRLAAALRTEAGTSMAIDIGAAQEMKRRGWARWLPGSGGRREREEPAVEQERRSRAERDHAGRPEPPEPDTPPWRDAAQDRRAERRLARDHDRDIGRS